MKAHHNVGGLPEDLQFELVEPLKFLFKDEVRVVARALGLPTPWCTVSPSPAPAWGCAAWGAITRGRPGGRCGRATPSCGRSSPRTAWRARCGSHFTIGPRL